MTKREKLEKLQELVIDKYIEALEMGVIHFRDMSPIVSLLGQNSMVEKPDNSKDNELDKRIKEARERRMKEHEERGQEDG